MPSGSLPLYAYRPNWATSQVARLRTCSNSRSRLFAGGTYFRSRDLGLKQNLISIQVQAFSATEAVCIVTNYGVVSSEMVTGQATARIFSGDLAYDDMIVIDQLNTIPRARNYSISFKIAPPPIIYADAGVFSFSSVFSWQSKLVVKLTPGAPVFASTDVITITARRRVYHLQPLTASDPVTLVTVTGWDINDLRSQINTGDPWIEMLPRSGADPITMLPPLTVNDYQDMGTDDLVLSAFAEAKMYGGDGLPDTPDRESSGPGRSLVHVNYGELYNGKYGETNTIYEWAGDTSTEGTWKAY